MLARQQTFAQELVAAVLDGEAVTERDLRATINTAVAHGDQIESDHSAIPAALGPYLQKVSRHAYKVTDGNVEVLKKQGYTEDAIFELTVCAAVGAGLGRLERGLALMGNGQSEQREVSDEVK